MRESIGLAEALGDSEAIGDLEELLVRLGTMQAIVAQAAIRMMKEAAFDLLLSRNGDHTFLVKGGEKTAHLPNRLGSNPMDFQTAAPVITALMWRTYQRLERELIASVSLEYSEDRKSSTRMPGRKGTRKGSYRRLANIKP